MRVVYAVFPPSFLFIFIYLFFILLCFVETGQMVWTNQETATSTLNQTLADITSDLGITLVRAVRGGARRIRESLERGGSKVMHQSNYRIPRRSGNQ